MSLLDIAAPPRHTATDQPGLASQLLYWLTRSDQSAEGTEALADPREKIHTAREKGYLIDIGI